MADNESNDDAGNESPGADAPAAAPDAPAESAPASTSEPQLVSAASAPTAASGRSAEPTAVEATTPAAAAPPPPKSLVRKIDDAIFAVEEGMIALFLGAIALMVFIDVVQRRLVAPDSKVGELIAGLFDITDEATRATIDGTVAPVLSAALGIGIVVFAWSAAERAHGKPYLRVPGSAWILGLLTAAGFAAIGWMIIAVESWIVYLVLWFMGLGLVTFDQVQRKPAGWQIRLGIGWLALTPLVVWVATSFFPEGYSWAKEVALLMTLWVGLFGASICVHEGKHIRLEALEKTHPEPAKKYLHALSSLVAAAFCGLMVYLGLDNVEMLHRIGMRLEMTHIPSWVQMVAVPLAFGMAGIRLIGVAASSIMGGTYGAPAKAEGMAEAEKAAAEKAAAEKAAGAVREAEEAHPPTSPTAAAAKKRPPVFYIVLAIILLSGALLGNAGILIAGILACALLAEPLFVVLGVVVLLCFYLWGSHSEPYLMRVSPLVERIGAIADNQALLAIPLFIMSGAVMGHGDISKKLIRFAQSLLGWLPGGLAISAVFACMIFAAISGSSPATVVAIGGIMGPALIAQGYRPEFAHGLVTSAGSLGILIPPSIPMIVYAIVNTTSLIRVEDLFAAGYGPGMVIGGILMGYSLYRGIVDKAPRQAFKLGEIGAAARDGFWALLFPIIIMGGITTGLFNAVESAGISVIYAVAVEIFIHRAIKLQHLPKIFQEVGVLLGSFLVILVVAMCFGEFLDQAEIPRMAAMWIEEQDLQPWQFLLLLNLLLLVAGALMDIMSAIFVFVPLLAPMANALGIDPLHLGIIFIVNLEIGYLTPPVGLNLFVASTLFNKPMGYLVRCVLPFIGFMAMGLMVITYYPPVSGDLGRWLNGSPAWVWVPPHYADEVEDDGGEIEDDGGDDTSPPPLARPACDPPGPPEDLNCDGSVTMEEMTAYSELPAPGTPPAPTAPACDPPEDLNCDGSVTMEEMTEYSERPASPPAPPPAAPRCDPPEDLNCDGSVTMDEMTEYSESL